MLLGNRIKELRISHGLLQRQIAAELDIDTPLYSKYERGERLPKKEQINQLASLFNIEDRELRILCLADKINKTLSKEDDIKTEVINNVINNIDQPNDLCKSESSQSHENNKY